MLADPFEGAEENFIAGFSFSRQLRMKRLVAPGLVAVFTLTACSGDLPSGSVVKTHLAAAGPVTGAPNTRRFIPFVHH